MKCPHCDAEMAEGSVRVWGDVLSLLTAGISMQDLRFYPPDPASQTIVVRAGERRDAHQCTACGGVFISGQADPNASPYRLPGI